MSIKLGNLTQENLLRRFFSWLLDLTKEVQMLKIIKNTLKSMIRNTVINTVRNTVAVATACFQQLMEVVQLHRLMLFSVVQPQMLVLLPQNLPPANLVENASHARAVKVARHVRAVKHVRAVRDVRAVRAAKAVSADASK